MFGYIKPVHTELLVKEYEFYKATYCGICRSMKKHTGTLSNLSLSYDSVLLALVRMLTVPDSEIGVKRGRCIAHPMKKRCMLKENSATVYTASAFAILTYFKALDDISDEGVGKRMLVGTVKPMLRRHSKKAAMPRLARVVEKKLSAISDLEAEGCGSVDIPAAIFGEVLGEIFSHGTEGETRLVFSEFGKSLGRFIYAIDAAEDYEQDRKKGKYNPYVKLYGGEPLTSENRSNIRTALLLECRKMEGAVNLMPFGNRATIENIVKNIVCLGLPKRTAFLEDGDNGKKGEENG